MSSRSNDVSEGVIWLVIIAVITSIAFPPLIIPWIIIGVIVIYGIHRSNSQYQQKIIECGISDIDRMSGSDFERYLTILFQKAGYHVKHTPISRDYGADLILTKNGMKSVVQAKRYSKNVGVKAIQEIVAARSHYGARQGAVITNSYFTKQAIALANSNQIQLIDRDNLIDFIINIKRGSGIVNAPAEEEFDEYTDF